MANHGKGVKKGDKRYRTNTVTQSVSFAHSLYQLLEENRAKKGPRQYRAAEIADALEFYYAATGRMPAGYHAQNPDLAEKARQVWKTMGATKS